jgi:uncharacterized protein YwbE
MSDKPKKVSIEETLSNLSAQRAQALVNNDQKTVKLIDAVIKRLLSKPRKS